MAVITTRRLEELQGECTEAGIEWQLSWGRAELFDALRKKFGAFDASTQIDPMKAIATKDMKSIDHLLTEDYVCEPKLDGVRMRCV